MPANEIFDQIQARASFDTRADAEAITRITLVNIARFLSAEDTLLLKEALPSPLGDYLGSETVAELDPAAYFDEVALDAAITIEECVDQVQAVCETLTELLSPEATSVFRSGLPRDLAHLFSFRSSYPPPVIQRFSRPPELIRDD